MSDLTSEQALSIIQRANSLSTSNSFPQTLQNKLIANLFFENSTRTRISFEVASKQLGANVINFDADRSSITKGETILDTIRTIESMGVNAIVIRHSDDNLLEDLADKTNLSLVNAGAGKNEHPSQALLDALTIYQEFKKWDGLTLAICGDIKHSRVAFSNMRLLQKLGAKVLLTGPTDLMPAQSQLPSNCQLCPNLDEAIEKADVVMMLRVQLERHAHLNIDQESYLKQWGLHQDRYKKLKSHAIVMHPGPFNRGIELSDDVVDSEKSRIFKQVQNGVFTRMSILEHLLT